MTKTLSTLRELAEKCTPAPWSAELDGVNKPARLQDICGPSGYNVARCTIYSTEQDVQLIAALRTALPEILEMGKREERLREALEYLISETKVLLTSGPGGGMSDKFTEQFAAIVKARAALDEKDS